MRRLPTLLMVLLSLALIYQGYQLFNLASADLSQIRADVGQNGLWRSARFYQSLQFAQFIEFAHKHIPRSARVVLLPDSSGSRALSSTPSMQFFLAPRVVLNCLEPDCLSHLDPANTVVILSSPDQQAWLPPGGQNLSFDARWGIASLDPNLALEGAPLRGFASLLALGLAFLPPLMWLSILTTGGVLLLQTLDHRFPWLVNIPLGFGLGLSIFSLGWALLWLIGLPLSAVSALGISTAVLLLGAVGWVTTRQRRRLASQAASATDAKLAFDPWLLLLVLVGLLSLLISVGKGYSATDEVVLWGAKGYGLATAGDLRAVTNWGTNTIAYPLHLPLWIAAMKLVVGENLPAAKLLPPLYSLGLSLLLYGFWVRWGVRRNAAGIGSLLLVTSPLWFRHSTIVYANLLLSFYLTAAVLLLAETLLISEEDSRSGRLVLAGIFFGAAAWTRPEGLLLAALILVGLLVWGWWRRLPLLTNPGAGLRLLLLVSPIFAYSLFWLMLERLIYVGRVANNELIPGALSALGAGSFHLDSIVYLSQAFLSRLVSPAIWGLWGVLLIFLVVLAVTIFVRSLLKKDQPDMRPVALALAGLLCTAAIFGLYYLAGFDTQHDLSWWVSTGFDRMLMPGLLLLWAGGLASLFRIPEPELQ
jgi:hypothetical protein